MSDEHAADDSDSRAAAEVGVDALALDNLLAWLSAGQPEGVATAEVNARWALALAAHLDAEASAVVSIDRPLYDGLVAGSKNGELPPSVRSLMRCAASEMSRLSALATRRSEQVADATADQHGPQCEEFLCRAPATTELRWNSGLVPVAIKVCDADARARRRQARGVGLVMFATPLPSDAPAAGAERA